MDFEFGSVRRSPVGMIQNEGQNLAVTFARIEGKTRNGILRTTLRSTAPPAVRNERRSRI
jgi:hypothetical protein